jgi:excisionase family DNA binding protein
MAQNPFEEIESRLSNIEQMLMDLKDNGSKTKTNQVKNLHSIQELADFLGCSTPKAQKLKNSGRIRYYQTGRKVIFNPAEILEDLKNKSK